MKKLIIIPILAIAITFCGCASTKSIVTPQSLRDGAAASVAAALLIKPEARTEITLVSGIVCALASAPGTTPAVLSDKLDSQPWNPETRLIVLGIQFGLGLAYNGLGTTNSFQPYLQGVCVGINLGLGQANIPPPSVTWSPQAQVPMRMQKSKSVVAPKASPPAWSDPNWPHVH